jgi:hypothetical protein
METIYMVRGIAGMPLALVFVTFTVCVHLLAPVSLYVRVMMLSDILLQPLDEWSAESIVNMAVFVLNVLSFIQTPRLPLFRLLQMECIADKHVTVANLHVHYRDAVISGSQGSCFWLVLSGVLGAETCSRSCFLFSTSGVAELRQGLFINNVRNRHYETINSRSSYVNSCSDIGRHSLGSTEAKWKCLRHLEKSTSWGHCLSQLPALLLIGCALLIIGYALPIDYIA